VQVAYGTDVSTLAPAITVTDLDQDNVNLSLNATNTPNITFSEWQINQGATPFTLSPTSGTFDQGNVTHDFTLTATDGTNSTSFTFHVDVGAPPAPVLGVSENGSSISANAPASGGRDFGSQGIAAGATAATTITVTNSGTADLQVTSVALGGADASEFVLDLTGFNYTITGGASSTFDVSFDPTSVGTKTAQVQITHNDTNAPSPFNFQVSGNGTGLAAIEVSEGGNTLSPGDQLVFGSVSTGGSSAVRTITVRNVGTGVLTLGAPTLAGPGAGAFSLDVSGMLNSLQPGSSTSFSLTFSPSTAGARAASVSFTHNDAAVSSPFSVNLSGDATAPGGSSNAGGSGGSSSGGCVAGGGTGIELLVLIMLLVAMFAARRLAGNRQ
jgi:hypothetical protein